MSSTSQQIKAIDKHSQALKMRQAGASYDDIARALNYKSASGAYNAIKSALKKTLQEPADELRFLELSRLDEALKAIWPDVKKGSLFAIDRFLKIGERRSRLLGLDAKTEISLQGEILAGNIDVVRDKRWESVTAQLAEILDE
ncbi:MAG: hypothetical protein PHQ36_01780 [Anaerolineales bacterium]|nr:hypothetical protein [Anaerolineales bacterium]